MAQIIFLSQLDIPALPVGNWSPWSPPTTALDSSSYGPDGKPLLRTQPFRSDTQVLDLMRWYGFDFGQQFMAPYHDWERRFWNQMQLRRFVENFDAEVIIVTTNPHSYDWTFYFQSWDASRRFSEAYWARQLPNGMQIRDSDSKAVAAWLAENVPGLYKISGSMVWIEDDQAAVLCKLRWVGAPTG